MEFDELISFLENKFNMNFKYEPDYNSSGFTINYKLFANNNFIGFIANPKSMYLDICYMYGTLWHDDLYKKIFEPCDFKIPNKFNTVEEFAKNEIKCLYTELVERLIMNKN